MPLETRQVLMRVDGVGTPFMAAYSATKFAVRGLTQAAGTIPV
jgi:NAD(P)-dependent dehydrogenase (short-subunit alcohol dehydrogenase family)